MARRGSQGTGPDLRGCVLGGRYELTGVIGFGGTSMVYAGRDRRLRRRVAVKVFEPACSRTDSQRRRIEQEACLGAQLDHPNLVPILDFNSERVWRGEERLFLVMPRLIGVTLHQRVLDGMIPWPHAVELIRDLLRGLEELHRRGVVHRDLKGSNCMLVRNRGGERLRILDFGLAKALRPQIITRPPTSIPGMIQGSLPYISPEQAQGKPVDERADLYSAGILLYELICRHRPFRGTEYEILDGHLHAPPPSPRIWVARPTWPRALDRILDRALAKDPADRFASAREFDRVLADLLDESGVAPPRLRCTLGHLGAEEAEEALAAWTRFDYARAREQAERAAALNHAWAPLKLLLSLLPEV